MISHRGTTRLRGQKTALLEGSNKPLPI